MFNFMAHWDISYSSLTGYHCVRLETLFFTVGLITAGIGPEIISIIQG
jgi:hypothetical protein